MAYKPGRVGPERITHPPRQTFDEPQVVLNSLAAKAAGDPGEPSASPAPPSLLDALRRLRESQAVKAAAPATVADDEAKALRKSRKRFRKHLAEGVSPARAAVLAHAHYKAKGGRSGIDVWSRKLAEGK